MSEWSDIWDAVGTVDPTKGICFWNYYKLFLNGYKLKDKKILEFGCGTGLNSIKMVKAGADVTFVDQSKRALKMVKENLDNLGLKANLLHMSVFDSKFDNEFDFVHSEGLVEHFKGTERQKIVDIHAKAAKRGGKVLLIIPHRKNPMYRIGKFIAELSGSWIYDNENPYTKKELVERMKLAGLTPGKIIGGETVFSTVWLFSPLVLKSPRLLKIGIENDVKNKKLLKLNYDNFFANNWGKNIGCLGEKI